MTPKNSKRNTKKNLKNALVGGLVTLSCAGVLHSFVKAAYAATISMPIMVRLVNAIEMTVSASMAFGTLAMTAEQGGSASLQPSTNKFVIDNGGSLALAGGTPQVGRVKVKGAAFPVTISLEDNTVQLTNGFASVTVKDFNILTDGAGRQVDYTPNLGANSFTVPIGGTLFTKPQQPSGTYIGRTRVFVNFQ